MKLKKTIKLSYFDFVDLVDEPYRTNKGAHASGFIDGIIHSTMAMRELGLNIMVIKKYIDEIDPHGETYIYDIITEEYEEYMNNLFV
jgi:hypothetical protein